MMTSPVLLLLLAYSVSGEDTSDYQVAADNSTGRSSTFWCGWGYCKWGMDCLEVDGSKQCVDPCGHHSILDDPRRSVSNELDEDEEDSLSDNRVDWDGWYRLMLGGLNAKMPESCAELEVAVNAAGTTLKRSM